MSLLANVNRDGKTVKEPYEYTQFQLIRPIKPAEEEVIVLENGFTPSDIAMIAHLRAIEAKQLKKKAINNVPS